MITFLIILYVISAIAQHVIYWNFANLSSRDDLRKYYFNDDSIWLIFTSLTPIINTGICIILLLMCYHTRQ